MTPSVLGHVKQV